MAIKLYIVQEDRREGGTILHVTHKRSEAYEVAAKFIVDHNNEDYVQRDYLIWDAEKFVNHYDNAWIWSASVVEDFKLEI